MEREVVIYIHGISPNVEFSTLRKNEENDKSKKKERKEKKVHKSHMKAYETLREGIKAKMKDDSKRSRWENAEHCYMEWGWDNDPKLDSRAIGRSKRLADAQKHMGERITSQMGCYQWIPLISHIRKLLLFGVSDIVYYVSDDGRQSIRKTICYQVMKNLSDTINQNEDRISLTLIGHSAGSVIALDLATYLFTDGELFLDELLHLDRKLEAQLTELKEPIRGFTKLGSVLQDDQRLVRYLIALRNLKREGRLSLHRLFTLGSPNSMLIRNDTYLDNQAYQGGIYLTSLGIPNMSDDDGRCRWTNIWNKYDFISFPFSGLLKEEDRQYMEDLHVRVSWNPLRSHTHYWNSPDVHAAIANRW